MALPATDTFTTGSDQLLTVYSASWSNNAGSHSVLAATNDCVGSAAGESGSFWNADAFNADQYAQIICNSVTATPAGPGVRHAGAGTNTYCGFYGDTAGSYVFRVVSGTWTQMGSSGAAFVNSSTYRIEASGDTLTPKKDGVTTGIGAQTNEGVPDTGSAGLVSFSGATTRMDSWEGGNLSTALTRNIGSDAARSVDTINASPLGEEHPALLVVLGEATIGSRSF